MLILSESSFARTRLLPTGAWDLGIMLQLVRSLSPFPASAFATLFADDRLSQPHSALGFIQLQ